MEPCHQRHPARSRPRPPGDRLPGRGDLGRLRPGARAAAPSGLGQRHRRRPDQHHRRLLPPLHRRGRGRSSDATWRPGFAGMKFKVGGKTPAEDAARVRVAREAAGPRLRRSWSMPTRATTGPRRSSSRGSSRDLDIRWFEEPCRWTNDARWMRDVRYQTGIPVCAGQSETTLAGVRDLIVGGRDRRLQLRRLVGRRPDDLAQGGRAGRGVRRRSSGITRSRRSPRTCSRACPITPSSSASTRSAIRSSGACPTCRPGSRAAATRCPNGRVSASSWTGTTSGPTPSRRGRRDRSTVA